MGRKLFILLMAYALGTACSAPAGTENGGPGNGQSSAEVPDKDGYLVKGMVLADGEPYAGAIVSDGVNVTMTDFDGRYWLRTAEDEDVVWLSIPSGYEADTENGWAPRFWHRLDCSKLAEGQVQRCDFSIRSVSQESFRLIVFSDTHIRGERAPQGISETDSVIFRNSFIPKLHELKDSRTYAVVLGDMISEYAVTKNGVGLPEYRRCLRGLDFPVFHIPGNHDYEGIQYQVHESEEAREAKRYYIDNFGPTYYSFNIGDNHFVMLDGTQMTGGGQNKYLSRVSRRQYEWLKKDLAKVRDKSLVICCHQPFYMHATAAAQGVGSILKENRDSIMALTASFPKVTILSGHQHYSDIYSMRNGLSEVFQYTHTGVCGPMYRLSQCVDGSPSGCTVYDFSGETYERTHVAYDDALDFDALFYTEGVASEANPDIECFLINVPQYEDGWSVVVLEDGIKVREASRVYRKDPGYVKAYAESGFPDQAGVRPINSSHIFEYVPQNRNASVRMSVRKGEKIMAEKTVNN